jgi:hypothetical protein
VKYQPPHGISDPNAPYINGNPALGQQGSIPPAAVFEQPQREIVGVVEKSGFVTSDIDLLQLAKGIRSQRLNYAVDTGTANNIVVVFDPPFVQPTNPYTVGLELHVRIRFTTINLDPGGTDSGLTSINAGAGNVRVRRMNGADRNPGDLTQGAIATLVYDGTGFQLSNFGGAGSTGPGDRFEVNIPYADDISPSPGTIRVDFDPAITVPPTAGDIFAVKIANTAPGATVMIINGLPAINLLPNGGGIMLQGDVAAGDVVQFFFDGVDLRFPPNPEINAPVTYTVGLPPNSQHFDTVDDAMTALRRKTIGANGFVELLLAPTTGGPPIMGPIVISHPSGDRIRVRGTMIGARPGVGDFRKTGNTLALRGQDALFNLTMLRTRFGTEIHIPPVGTGVANVGPGTVQFHDLLIVGDELPMPGSWWDQNGTSLGAGLNASFFNVAVWGSQVGFNSAGGMNCLQCWAIWNSHVGYHSAGSGAWLQRSGAYGNGNGGIVAVFGSLWMQFGSSEMNGSYGVWCDTTSGSALWWIDSMNNGGADLFANISSSIGMIQPEIGDTSGGGNFTTANPPVGVVGNFNSIIATMRIAKPPNAP